MCGIGVEENLVNLAHVHIEIIPVHKNHADKEVTPILENHVDARTDLIHENHVDVEVTLIPENHVDDRTVHVRAGMLIGVQIPREAASSQRSYGRYESCLTESHSVAVIGRNQTGPNAEQIYTSIV